MNFALLFAASSMPKRPRLAVPYLGNKTAWAPATVGAMERTFGPCAKWPAFTELAAGTAAITFEVLRHCPKLRATVIDAGPWGVVHEVLQTKRGALLAAVKRLIHPDGATAYTTCRTFYGKQVPSDSVQLAVAWIAMLRAQDGRRPPSTATGTWKPQCNYRTKRNSPESVDALYAWIMSAPRYRAVHGQAEAHQFRRGEVVYIDPPYAHQNYYGHSIDLPGIVAKARTAGARVVIAHNGPYPGIRGRRVKLDDRNCVWGTCRPEVLIFP